MKRAKLQSVDYETPNGPITCQRGWWFSSHEQVLIHCIVWVHVHRINAALLLPLVEVLGNALFRCAYQQVCNIYNILDHFFKPKNHHLMVNTQESLYQRRARSHMEFCSK